MEQLESTPLAVVDVETTGLFPRPHGYDRVIEIGIVRATCHGEILDEYETLINAGRDLGPVDLHGILGHHVREAPAFSGVAGDIARRLDGAILVGHNVLFDYRFLASEFDRLGYTLPSLPMLCTMRLPHDLGLYTPARSLESCCSHYGIPLERAHAALSDARATLRLLLTFLREAGEGCNGRIRFAGEDTVCRINGVDRFEPCLPPLTRTEAERRRKENDSYLARLVSQLPAVGNCGSADAGSIATYLDLLDRALEDRRLTMTEAELLHRFASDQGLTADDVAQAHGEYLGGLAATAATDGVVTPAEEKDLIEAGRLLGFSEEEVLKAIERAASANRSPIRSPREDLHGKTVCFTGQMTCWIDGQPVTRDRAQALAAAAGLVPVPSVTKRLDVLVVADPDSLSGKAEKARRYGTRIVAEAVFWRWLGLKAEDSARL